MSTLTESLAKGLASRFISEHSERAAIVESRVVALTRDIPSSGFVKQAKWQAFARKLSDIHRGSRLSEVEFGSKRKKVVVLHYIGAPVTNPSGDWEEDAVPVGYFARASPAGL